MIPPRIQAHRLPAPLHLVQPKQVGRFRAAADRALAVYISMPERCHWTAPLGQGTGDPMSAFRSNARQRKNSQVSSVDSLESRRMFDAAAPAPPDVPIAGPFVLNAEFDARTAPHEVRFTFNEDVSQSLDGSDLVLINDLGRFVIPAEVITVNWDAGTNTASFIFVRLEGGGVLPEGRWHATLLSEGVTNADGQPLDGDLDFQIGGDFNFEFHFLRGDANMDGTVDLKDFNLLTANFGQTNRTFIDGDFNYDSHVSLADLNLFAERYGTSIAGTTESPFGQTAIDSTLADTEPEMTA
jgi:hypothetical protein